MTNIDRLKLQQKFKSFKQRHNNVFNKGFRRQTQSLRNNKNRFAQKPRQGKDEEESLEEENKRYGKRIDLIRKKLREVLAYSSRTTARPTSLARTFVPSHLKSENIEPTRTQEIDLSTSTASLVIDRNIFKPKFRKNMLDGRLSSVKIDPESGEEEVTDFEPTVTSIDDNDYIEEVEIVSSKVIPESVGEETTTVIVPKPITDPIPSTKKVSGIPRRYVYNDENNYNQFVNIDTELEGGDSQNIDVIVSNNDRIDVDPDSLEYKEVELGGQSREEQQVPLYNVFSNLDLTTLPYVNNKQHTTPTIPNKEYFNPRPTIPTLLPSYDINSLNKMFRFPTGTPALASLPTLPNYLPQLPQYPLLSPEQLTYLQLINQGIKTNPGIQGQLGRPRSEPSFTTIINSQVKTTSVTVTESEEFKVMFRNRPITTTVLSTTIKPTVVTEYMTITRRLPHG